VYFNILTYFSFINKMHIRQYQKSDSEQIKKLFFEFGNYLKSLDDLGLVVVKDGYGEISLKKMMENTDDNLGRIFVAETDEHIVVGFIAGVITEVGGVEDVDHRPHKSGKVFEFFVKEEYQRNGLGLILMQEMEKYFKENGCLKMNLDMIARNKGAFAFYTKFGFNIRNYELIKMLK
jgi:ribosomal protein S18 acetylase RimI-like enzyme